MLSFLKTAVSELFTPATRNPRSPRKRPQARLNVETLETRVVPAVTAFTMEPLPDVHLSPGQHDVPVAQFSVKGTHWKSALNSVVLDDTVQGALKNVRSGTLYYESSPGNWTALDSSPVSTAAGGRIGFNRFGWVPVGDFDGARFQVRVDAIDAAFTPVHGELTIFGANIRYAGTKTFAATTQPGDNQEEFPVTTVGGPQRTIYHIVDLPDSATTVNANSRDQTVFELYVNSSDQRAYANCMRFITKDATALPFVRTATFYREISPGVWHAMMTVKPDANGRLIFTVYKVHQQFKTNGMVHLQVRVNTDPAMVGERNVKMAWYFSTSPYAGQKSFDVLELNAPQPPVSHGMLSASALFYPVNSGQNAVLADINIGGNQWSAFDRLDAYVGSGTFAGASNFRLYALDADNPTGLSLGTVTYLDNGAVTITGIGFTINWSHKFRLIADLTNFVQLGSVIAQG